MVVLRYGKNIFAVIIIDWWLFYIYVIGGKRKRQSLMNVVTDWDNEVDWLEWLLIIIILIINS